MATRVRLGLGPVFAYEWLAASRRWQGYALRSTLVTLMLLGLSGVWLANADASGEVSIREMADFGRAIYAVTTLILLGLVGLAAPAATAGSVCLDKDRGNLTLLFASDLGDAEIVLGKLAARLIPVLGLIACAAPVLATSTLFGGVDPMMPTGSILVCLACAVFGCTLAMTLSVWGRHVHEVLLATYAFGILWLLLAPLWAALYFFLPGSFRPSWFPGQFALFPYNPVFLVMAPLGDGSGPPGVGFVGFGAQVRFCALGLLTSAILAAAAILGIRRVTARQDGGGRASGRRRWWDRAGRIGLNLVAPWPTPSLDGNPVLWREWHRRGPSGWSVLIWGGFAALSSLASVFMIVAALRNPGSGAREVAGLLGGAEASAGLLLLSVASATSLAEERRRGSLDVLLATPLSTRAIVLGKWWGAVRGVPALIAWPALIAASLAIPHGFAPGVLLVVGLMLAYAAAITSLGLALATWLPRMGQAIGLTSGLYLAVLIGAVPCAMMIFGDGPGELGPALAAASPFWGVGMSTVFFGGDHPANGSMGEPAAWVACWTVAYGAIALGLLWATLMTFDRCLGRNDGSRRPGAGGP